MAINQDDELARARSAREAARRRASMERTIKRCDRVLVRWLSAKFNDVETARDLAQSAYLRALRFVDESHVENPQAFLFKTAANLAANEFRARSRAFRTVRGGGDEGASELDSVPCERPNPERAAAARQDLELSLQAIESLPPRVRRAFMLSRFEEKSYREIAAEMNVSESSVEKYIITALKTLRAALAPDAQRPRAGGADEKPLRINSKKRLVETKI